MLHLIVGRRNVVHQWFYEYLKLYVWKQNKKYQDIMKLKVIHGQARACITLYSKSPMSSPKANLFVRGIKGIGTKKINLYLLLGYTYQEHLLKPWNNYTRSSLAENAIGFQGLVVKKYAYNFFYCSYRWSVESCIIKLACKSWLCE